MKATLRALALATAALVVVPAAAATAHPATTAAPTVATAEVAAPEAQARDIASDASPGVAPHTGPVAPPTAGGPHHVPASFIDGLRAEIQNPHGELPSTNDWDCQLTPERPRPVILVHGTFLNRQDSWGYMAPALANEGYCVYALTYGAHPQAPWPLSALGGTLPMEDSAAELAEFVDRVRSATGADKVDLLGYSQGTVMPAVYVNELGGHQYVANYIGLGSVWRGSTAFFLSTIFDAFGQVGLRDPLESFVHSVGCGACNQVLAGSQFFHDLWADGTPYHPDVQYTNIVTRYDEVVTPYTSGIVEAPNAVNHVVQDHCAHDFSEHLSIAASPVSRDLVLGALDPSSPRAVSCTFVPPVTPIGS